MQQVIDFLVAWAEAKWPGVRDIIELVRPYLTPDEIGNLIMQAIKDYEQGMSFLDILIDLLKGTGKLPAHVEASLTP